MENAVEKTVEKIISLMAARPQITTKEIIMEAGLTRRGVEWNIARLKEQRRIKRIGPDRGGRWEVVANRKEENGNKKD